MHSATSTSGDACPSGATPPPSFINFAYGSNMFTRRLRERTPSARPVGLARLPGHRLMWHKIGRDGSAKCDVLATGRSDDLVWGVLFEIAMSERPLLDQAEGLGRGYEHKNVEVVADAGAVVAGVYYATDIDPALRPFDWYLAFVIEGAREHGLPASYVQQIALITAKIDPDRVRRETHLALLHNR
jgi:gamma-glutamylcyclotransferase